MHLSQKWLNTASLNASERSPYVFYPAGFPIACAKACPSIMVQVLSSVVGFPCAALFVDRRFPAVSAMASGTGECL